MSGSPKFGILEKDGQEYEWPVEYLPEAEDIRYINSNSQTLKQKIDEIQNGVSFLYGTLDRDVEIPVDKALVMVSPKIGDHTIKIKGTLRII